VPQDEPFQRCWQAPCTRWHGPRGILVPTRIPEGVEYAADDVPSMSTCPLSSMSAQITPRPRYSQVLVGVSFTISGLLSGLPYSRSTRARLIPIAMSPI